MVYPGKNLVELEKRLKTYKACEQHVCMIRKALYELR